MDLEFGDGQRCEARERFLSKSIDYEIYDLASEQAPAAAQKAVSLGGRVLVEPRADRHGGMLAILADPSGAPFGVMEWSESDAPQEQP